jgi:hypothetical protein
MERRAASPPPEPAEATPPPEPELQPQPERQPEPDTATWQRVEEIEFPDRDDDPSYEPTPLPEPDQQESAARAAARHYRRLRHSEQRRVPAATPAGSPPRLPRPSRERHTLPIRAHGPRDLALPAGLVIIAALVIMAVAGVFGGGTSTPPAGTQANAAPVKVALAEQSVTAMSTAQAVRLIASRPRSAATP